METYTNDKGEVVVIAEMESRRLIHAIAKYSRIEATFESKVGTDGINEASVREISEVVKALKEEAIKRLTLQA